MKNYVLVKYKRDFFNTCATMKHVSNSSFVLSGLGVRQWVCHFPPSDFMMNKGCSKTIAVPDKIKES